MMTLNHHTTHIASSHLDEQYINNNGFYYEFGFWFTTCILHFKVQIQPPKTVLRMTRSYSSRSFFLFNVPLVTPPFIALSFLNLSFLFEICFSRFDLFAISTFQDAPIHAIVYTINISLPYRRRLLWHEDVKI